MMRILVYSPSYPPVRCGIGDYTRELAGALAARGHEVTVVTACSTAPDAARNPRVLAVLRGWGVTDFLRTLRLVARPRPDIVLSGFPAVVPGRRVRMLYLLPGFAKIALGRPRTVLIVHEFVRAAARERNLLGLALHAADRILAVTEHERAAIVERYPRLAARLIVAANAPTIAALDADPSGDDEFRAALAPSATPLLAFFGHLASEDKGFDDALEALALSEGAVLAATGELDPATVPYHAQIAARIARLDLGDRVRWLGYVPDEDVGRLLRVADAVLLPYRLGADASYTSLLAALVNGAAVVTTRGPQNPAWLADCALLVEPSDPPAVAAAVRRLLDEPDTAAGIRAGALAQSFSWDAIADAVLERPAPRPGLCARLVRMSALRSAVRKLLPQAASDAIFRTFLRRRALRRAAERFAPREVSHSYCGVPLRVSLEDPIGEQWYDRDWPLLPEIRELQQRGLGPGARVFDIGAHQCVVALVLADIVGPDGSVVALEPEPHNGRVARRNLELNGARNVAVVDAAVSAKPGSVRFEENFGGRIVDHARGTIEVQAVTIDDLAARHGQPDVVFVDVEGAEAAALAGARRTLRRGRATWFVEVHQGLGLTPRGVGGAEDVLAEFPAQSFDVLVAVENDDLTHSFRPLAEGMPEGRFFLIATPRTGATA